MIGAGMTTWRTGYRAVSMHPRTPSGGNRSRQRIGLRLDNLVPYRIPHQRGSRGEVELAHGGGAVRLHRLDADVQDIGDLLVAVALGDELDHPALARGQHV